MGYSVTFELEEIEPCEEGSVGWLGRMKGGFWGLSKEGGRENGRKK